MFYSQYFYCARGNLSADCRKASKNEIHSPWYNRQHPASFWWMDVRKRLAVNMKRLRKERGWSQEALTDAAGQYRTYISGIERKVEKPTLTVTVTLECRPGDLLGSKVWPMANNEPEERLRTAMTTLRSRTLILLAWRSPLHPKDHRIPTVAAY